MYTAIRRRQRWIHLKLQVCNSMWYEDPDWTGTCTEMKKRMKGVHVWTLILGIHEGHSNSGFRDPLQVFSQVPKRRLPWTSTALKFVFKQPKVQIHEVSSLCSSRTCERYYFGRGLLSHTRIVSQHLEAIFKLILRFTSVKKLWWSIWIVEDQDSPSIDSLGMKWQPLMIQWQVELWRMTVLEEDW